MVQKVLAVCRDEACAFGYHRAMCALTGGNSVKDAYIQHTDCLS
jgi:hypothetical protein